MQTITWGHPSPANVERFMVTISPVKGPSESSRTIDVGKPASVPSGSLEIFTALVQMEFDEFVSVAAVGRNGLTSLPSVWSGVPPTRPGQPRVVDAP